MMLIGTLKSKRKVLSMMSDVNRQKLASRELEVGTFTNALGKMLTKRNFKELKTL